MSTYRTLLSEPEITAANRSKQTSDEIRIRAAMMGSPGWSSSDQTTLTRLAARAAHLLNGGVA